MTENDRLPDEAIPEICDEMEYPAGLTAQYELLECLSEKGDSRTLLVRDRSDGRFGIAKCFGKENPLFLYTEPDSLKENRIAPMPEFLGEYRNDSMRVTVREYIEGETLDKAAESRSFSEEEIRRTGLQLCEQIALLHSLEPPVIHRDIKPQNVILRKDGQAVLIDFGIARAVSGKTADTVAFGTQGFAPPEQYGFAQTDERSDIYSLGMLLFWLLHRSLDLSESGDTGLDAVLSRCTAFDPERRYPDISQVKKALQEYPEPPADEISSGTAQKTTARKPHPRIPVFLMILAVLAAAVLFFLRPWKQDRVVFQDELIEEAAKLALGKEGEALSGEDLLQVKNIYIVADQAYPDEEGFYSAIGNWYAGGMSTRGPLSDLKDLSRMPNLEQVCVTCQEITDISALQELEKLNKVGLKHNKVGDISALEGKKELTSVGVNGNPVTDISPLTSCPSLAFLDLCDVTDYDPEVFADLGDFEYLDISNPTASWNYLGSRSIRNLRMGWTEFSDLSVLSEVKGLSGLEIEHTEVTDLSPLENHPSLTYLKISGVPASDLSVLKTLPALERVEADELMRGRLEKLGDVRFEIIYE